MFRRPDSAANVAPSFAAGFARVMVKNLANGEILATTVANADGEFAFYLPRGVAAEARVEPPTKAATGDARGEAYAPAIWRIAARKIDTTAVLRFALTLRPKDRVESEESLARRVFAESVKALLVAERQHSAQQSLKSLENNGENNAENSAKNNADKEIKEAAARKSPPKMPETRQVLLSFANTKAILLMATDSADKPSKKPWREVLDGLAREINAEISRIAKIVVVGHTDDIADEEANQAEGWQRAEFIVQELIKRGTPSSALIATSKGFKEPLPRRANESDFAYRARLRRVEIMKIWKNDGANAEK